MCPPSLFTVNSMTQGYSALLKRNAELGSRPVIWTARAAVQVPQELVIDEAGLTKNAADAAAAAAVVALYPNWSK